MHSFYREAGFSRLLQAPVRPPRYRSLLSIREAVGEKEQGRGEEQLPRP